MPAPFCQYLFSSFFKKVFPYYILHFPVDILPNMLHFTFSPPDEQIPPHPEHKPKYPLPLSSKSLLSLFQDCADLTQRQLLAGTNGSVQAEILFLDGMVSGSEVAETILRPFTDAARFSQCNTPEDCLRLALAGGIYAGTVMQRDTTDDAVTDLLQGCCLVIFDSLGKCLSFEVRGEQRRGVEQPGLEKSVKGAKDAFSETLRTNTALVRRKLRVPELAVTQHTIGRKSQTTVAVLYLKELTDPALVERVRRRLEHIDFEGLVTAGALEDFLTDRPNSPFPQLIHTERPDRFATDLLQGRVGLLVDGIPIGFLLPAGLGSFLRVTEDYASHWLVASSITALRYLALVISLMLPAVYVSIAMYHQEMIPLHLLESVIRSKQNVPFSTAVEILAMLVAFELLQEAGLRLPDPIGQTVSIIGALIVGQSAVEASVISPIAVIVVALAGICGYTQPSQDLGAALRLCRFLLVLGAILAGMVGVFAGVVLLVYHLAGLESLGHSYLSPLDEGRLFAAFRQLFRLPSWKEKTRPEELRPSDRRRVK